MGYSKEIKEFFNVTSTADEEAFATKSDWRGAKLRTGNTQKVIFYIFTSTRASMENALTFYKAKAKPLRIKEGEPRFPRSLRELYEVYILRGLAQDGFKLTKEQIEYLNKFIVDEEDA